MWTALPGSTSFTGKLGHGYGVPSWPLRAVGELGPKGGIPVFFFVHLAGTLDNWDPSVTDPIANNRHVIAFYNRGIGVSTGQVPDPVEAMGDDAYTFIKALGFSKIDIFSFSLGGFVAQALVVKHPDLVRKLVLTGTGPKGGKDLVLTGHGPEGR
jgi:pimeloyl-ACP methyl ester carboxylesterase